MSTQLHFRSITLSAWKSVVSIIESLSLLLRVAFLLSGVFRPNANSIWHRVHSKRHTQVPSIIFIAIVSPPSTAPHRLKQLLQLDNRLFFSRIRQSVTRYWHFRLGPPYSLHLLLKVLSIVQASMTFPGPFAIQPIWVELFYLKFTAKSRLVHIFSLFLLPLTCTYYISLSK